MATRVDAKTVKYMIVVVVVAAVMMELLGSYVV